MFRSLAKDEDSPATDPSTEVLNLNNYIVDLNTLIGFINDSPKKSRNRSLVVTKLEEAIHRLKDAIDEEDR